MIKFKYNPLLDTYDKIEYFEGETIHEIILRICEEKHIPAEYQQHLIDHVHVHVGGSKIDSDFFKYLKPRAGVDVIVSIVPQGGGFGQIFKTVAIIAIIAVASVYTPFAAGGLAAAFFTAGVGLAAFLVFNALIPPPSPGMGASNLGGGVKSYEDSQTFTITSQSNSMNKFGKVPQVYGTHRIFPIIAANPYTDFESLGGEQVQFYYAIYDFGLGPLSIEQIRIGETAIEDYDDVTYRLVDLNKPIVSTGPWDDVLFDTFDLYKGDVSQLPLAFAFNGDGDQAVSDAALNPDGSEQEITIRLVAGGGLNSFGTDGTRGRSTVEFSVDFRETGSPTWIAYGNSDFTHNFPLMPDTVLNSIIKDREVADGYTQLTNEIINSWDAADRTAISPGAWDLSFVPVTIYDNGFLLGMPIYGGYQYQEFGFGDTETPFLILNQDYPIGIRIQGNSFDFGVIRTKVLHSPGFWKYTFDDLISRSIVLFYNYHGDPTSFDGDFYPSRYAYPSDRKKIGTFIPKENQSNVVVFSGNTQKAIYKEVVIRPITTNRVEVRVTRIRDYSDNSFQVTNGITWNELKTRFDKDAIQTPLRHCFLELKIKATDQINSSISNLSAIATSVLDVYNSGTGLWEKQRTASPPWIVADLMTGQVNKRAIDKSRIDTASFLEWETYCNERPVSQIPGTEFTAVRYTTNFVLDYATTVKQAIDQVCSSAQASLNILGSNYGVLLDKTNNIPVQMFTPRNSYNFNSFKGYAVLPDYLSVRYVDVGSNWDLRSINVFSDGKDLTNSKTTEDMDAFACTNAEQAFRFGRYMMAQGKYRQEVVGIQVDFENLICNRGDFVLFQNDVMKSGGSPARIRAVAGNLITIDDAFVTAPMINYGYTARLVTGEIVTDTMTIINSTQANVNGTIPAVGDLIVWGEVDKITTEWIVKSISPSDDLSANLTLVEKNDLIFEAETTAWLPGYDPQISTDNNDPSTAPAYVANLLESTNGWDCEGSTYVFFIDITWDDPLNSVWETFEVYSNVDGAGYQLDGFSSLNSYRFTGATIEQGNEVKLKVLAVNSLGVKKDISGALEIVTTLIGKTTPPSTVPNLFTNVTNETIQLDWDLIEDCDIANYRIRFSPDLTNASWEQSTFLLKTDGNTDYGFAQARTGTYFVKAIDIAGRESLVAALAVTSIPNLVNLNIIEEIDDFPTLLGSFGNIEAFGDTLILKDQNAVLPSNFFSLGYYYLNSLLNLGEIYTARLQAYLITGGFNKNDVMTAWTTLTSVTQMTSSTGSDYSVAFEYRATDQFNVMAEWATLTSIPTLSGGSPDIWTNWRRFEIGDFTARIFMFRIKLESFNPVISAQVFEGKVIADMPDRIYNIEDTTAPISGIAITFNPAFAGPIKPNIQITQENAQQGDYYVITNRSITGFDIEFFDKTDTSVSRIFDAAIKGYGRKSTIVI